MYFRVRRSKVKVTRGQDRFGGLAEASFWTPLGPVAFLVVLSLKLGLILRMQSSCVK